MKITNKLKVVWICHFSNKDFNQRLPLRISCLYGFIYKLFKGRAATTDVSDFGVWNINALNEIKKFTNRVDLHVIAPYPHLAHNTYEFEEDGINYHFFRPKTVLLEKIMNHFPSIYNLYKPSYRSNRIIIKSWITKIQPSIVHIIGAENPYYSLSGLDIPRDMKLIIQLQTIMSDPKFFANYPIDKRLYDYRVGIEKKVIKRADYVGTTIQYYKDVIHKYISTNIKYLDFKLAIGVNIRKFDKEKEYDFVYFACSISKAGDWAIDSFIKASEIKPGITMLVIGGYIQSEKERYEKLLTKYGLLDKVTFTGLLPTHDDVLQAVSKARIALLPIKIVYIPSTIREANALGLPVVTSITDGTPLLNEKRQCVLLSKGGDHVQMANNMIKVLENPILSEELVQNSYMRLIESYDNYSSITSWIEGYEEVVAQ